MSVAVLPDLESIAIEYLLDTDVADAVEDRIYDEPIADVAWPFLTVSRIGGTPRLHHTLDEAHLEVAAWTIKGSNDPRATARSICEAAIAALHELHEQSPSVICEDVMGPRFVPDPPTSNARYIGEVLLRIHPGPEGS